METGIATLVCYAGVFGDVIGTEEVATRLGVSGQVEFSTALNALHREGKIILRDGFAGLPDLAEKIDLKNSKIKSAAQLINSRMEDILKLGRNPMIKFVGISGSLAASNPTKDRNNLLDIDIFLITRSQCLWLYALPRIIQGQFTRKVQDLRLCDNLIMDETNLEITTRNLYTATEIRNLIPISGLEAYRKFLQANSWVDYYYPGFSGSSQSTPADSSRNYANKAFYILFNIMRSLKRCSLEPLKKLSFRTDPMRGDNYNRLSVAYGGYHAMVNSNFTRLAGLWFPDLLDVRTVENLFPDDLSTGMRDGSLDAHKISTAAGFRYDYSKYGFHKILPNGS